MHYFKLFKGAILELLGERMVLVDEAMVHAEEPPRRDVGRPVAMCRRIPAEIVKSGMDAAVGATFYGIALDDMTREELIAAAALGWKKYSEIMLNDAYAEWQAENRRNEFHKVL